MKLPELFKNKLDDKITNKKEIFISSKIKEEREEDILDNLPVDVIITSKRYKNLKATVVGKTENYIITKNREVIAKEDIKKIKKA